MKKFNIFLMLIFIFTTVFTACEDKIIDTTEDKIQTSIKVTHINIPYVYNVTNESDITIEGKGFEQTDSITFIPRGGQGGGTIKLGIKTIEDEKVALENSPYFRDGEYEIRIQRGILDQLLGRTFVNRIFNASIPDREGMTVKGTVHSNGQGVANVIVSDGIEFAVTDQNGVYYLPSAKKHGFVFITVPANYEVSVINTIPQFFKRLAGLASATEIKDFELFPVNNENHVVAFMTDMHLANRNNDLTQFQSFIEDVKNVYEEYKGQNKKFYGITLGDQTWDQYWYSNNFKLENYVDQIKSLEFPIYNVIGNHDYNPYVSANDWLGAAEYRKVLGPTYYSINIGRVHYIILDNMQWLNDGGSQGVVGERNYRDFLDQEQLTWLAKDLSYITDKSTPIVIATHVPLFTNPDQNGNFNNAMENTSELLAAVSEFTNVKVATGHTHINYRNSPAGSNVYEQNIAAVSATWWWTGATSAANHISRDGSPGGYAIWEMTGRNQQWYYKSIGFDKDYQFRSYDLNNIHITSATYTPSATDEFKGKVAGYAGEFATANKNNQVLINVWGYQDNWKVTVKENGNTLPVTRVRKKDPLHIISYEMQRLNANAEPTSSFVTVNSAHLFLATASNATSTLEITVEDEFGNKYTETMVRPKAFTYSMR
ncbi:calcineurin-like phosphoesterase C-terminal domain-containing protein [Sphingobacterium sp. SGL-16]|uniref:Calcineurin-like phosphoesterase C-terminal domain-containing protein n=2 Tax=Sphingobacterium litopenaei TaxID=2763500 RepID=A0ABR7YE83_9SPHI|nr:calcineurin-like phosphoesterase family protein [Sphingobacterium sp. SGL-16]MBD1429623.1 calcineurin-like phosphoesterase C-terminal domain-containing protein [Sphingobacterium litopenaei]NGM73026.1 metallophosphoesterase [Sphingobacterium sp. SGL-16]